MDHYDEHSILYIGFCMLGPNFYELCEALLARRIYFKQGEWLHSAYSVIL